MAISPSFIPKGILLDLDGTILRKDLVLSNRVVQAIQKLSSVIPIGLCSGRTYAALQSAILPHFPQESVHVLAGGGQMMRTNGTVIWESLIPSERVQDIAQHAEDSGARFIFGQNDLLFCSPSEQKNFEQYAWNIRIGDTKNLKDWSAPLISVIHLNEKISSYLTSISDVNAQRMINRKGQPYFDITHLGITKGTGAARWCIHQEIDSKDVAAAGDNLNDIGMLKEVGYRVVVNTAPPEILQLADEVVAPAEEDGVAEYLEKVFTHITKNT